MTSVDVRIAGEAVERLKPPQRSMIDGGPDSVTVRTCVLGHPLQRRREVSLTVDQATAALFSQACRRQTIWNRAVAPGAAVLVVALLIVAASPLGDRLDSVWTPVCTALLIAVLGGRGMTSRLASPLHPRWQGRMVLIRGIDRTAADEWASANSPEAIRIQG